MAKSDQSVLDIAYVLDVNVHNVHIIISKRSESTTVLKED